MIEWLKKSSDYLARNKGLPVVVGVGLVILDFFLQFLPAWPVIGWLAQFNFFLHLGIVIGLLGILIGDAL